MQLAAETADVGSKHVRPLFLSLGPARLVLYESALQAGVPGARAPDGTLFLFEHHLGGRPGHSWLNSDESQKLEREAESGFAHRKAEYRAAVDALKRIA